MRALKSSFAIAAAAGLVAFAQGQSFSNPILARPAADPSVVLVDGKYYSVQSGGCRVEARPAICVRASGSLPGLSAAPAIPVWVAPLAGPNAKEIWAPQIEYLDGRWYIYYAADPSGENDHRLFALVPKDNSKPLGPWQEASTGAPAGGFVTDWKSRWAIDPMVYKATDERYYMLYSCRQDDSGTPDGNEQSICLAPMSDPLHLVTDPQTQKEVVRLSTPTLTWERRGWPTQEGPFGLTHEGKDYILYSGSFSGNPDQYTEGVLINDHPPQPEGTNPLTNPAAWVKDGPIFDGHHASYGTASTVLVDSPDHTELWQVYHGTDCLKDCPVRAGKTWIDRSDRAQKAGWSPQGELVLGYPVDIRNMDGTGEDVALPLPSRDGLGRSVIGSWGSAFGDAAENDLAHGRQIGEWTATGPTAISHRLSTTSPLAQSFFASNPNWTEYIVSTSVQLREAGKQSPRSRFGVYGAYVDHQNWFAAMIDLTSCGAAPCVMTGGTAAGVTQAWLSCPLAAAFDPRAVNALSVQAVEGRFTVSVNGQRLAGSCQDRAFDLSASQRHAGNGQAGVLVESADVAYTNFDVSPGVPLDSRKSGQIYAFRNGMSRLNLDSGCNEGCKPKAVKGGMVFARAPFAPYPLTTSKAQIWRLMDRGAGLFALANEATGFCLDAAVDAKSAGGSLSQQAVRKVRKPSVASASRRPQKRICPLRRKLGNGAKQSARRFEPSGCPGSSFGERRAGVAVDCAVAHRR